jgi:hypothetical protein
VLSLENSLHIGHQFQSQHTKFWATVVDGGQAHRSQNSIWHWRRARDLQKVAARWMEVKLKH